MVAMKPRKPNLTRRDVRIILDHCKGAADEFEKGFPLVARLHLGSIALVALRIQNREGRDRRV
jgi:hypothetical protein